MNTKPQYLETLFTLYFPRRFFFMKEFMSLQKDVAFVLVSHIDEVLQAAFTGGMTTAVSPQDMGSVMSKL
jgi:hypothetical protein